MKHWATIVVAVIMTGLASCQAPQTHDGPRHRRFAAAGPRVAVKVISVDSLPVGTESPLNDILLLPDFVLRDCTVRILAGPYSKECPGKITYNIKDSLLEVVVENAWAYVVVKRPTEAPAGCNWGKARTKRVSGTAQGTEFLVQHQWLDAREVHRVIQLSPPPDKVTVALVENQADSRELSEADKYYEVLDDQPLPSTPSFSAPGSDVDLLVKYVRSAAASAGLR
jgi:hypothetical protein